MELFPVVLDTTFLLPLFEYGVNLGSNFNQELCELWEKGKEGFSLHVSSASFIECAYKLNREFRKNGDPYVLSRYPASLPTIITSRVVAVVDSFMDVQICEVAMLIRQAGHLDLMDCWIAATAVVMRGGLVTEDEPLAKILSALPEVKGVEVWSWNEFFHKKEASTS